MAKYEMRGGGTVSGDNVCEVVAIETCLLIRRPTPGRLCASLRQGARFMTARKSERTPPKTR